MPWAWKAGMQSPSPMRFSHVNTTGLASVPAAMAVCAVCVTGAGAQEGLNGGNANEACGCGRAAGSAPWQCGREEFNLLLYCTLISKEQGDLVPAQSFLALRAPGPAANGTPGFTDRKTAEKTKKPAIMVNTAK